jgi:hypothetical protein
MRQAFQFQREETSSASAFACSLRRRGHTRGGDPKRVSNDCLSTRSTLGRQILGQSFLWLSYFLRWNKTCKVLDRQDNNHQAGQWSISAIFRRELVSRESLYPRRRNSSPVFWKHRLSRLPPSPGSLQVSGGLRTLIGTQTARH